MKYKLNLIFLVFICSTINVEKKIPFTADMLPVLTNITAINSMAKIDSIWI